MTKYLLTVLALSTLTFTSCSKDDVLTKEDFKATMKDALTEINTENKIEDNALIGTWEANIFDHSDQAVAVKYIFNSDKTFTHSVNDETGTFYIKNRYGNEKRITTTVKGKGDSYNENSVNYEIVDGKLLIKTRHNNTIEFTKK